MIQVINQEQLVNYLSSTATGTQWVNVAAQGVTSVGLSMPAAFTVANSPITQSGTLTVTGAGTAAQYINGLGNLVTFPTIPTLNMFYRLLQP